ncbi:predicted protein [Naegleria gruberi]|uniref:Predicted protein n=1 Tax=Naegleria gruberi TaxID=5762 RepID=D2VMK4_NAEGR|nr:uncharacterized protein NAEGRDRAFT_70167 [Naegleria gruberi]EFC42080.1 predicted protein [Naegleria gruberi]|eukprot:XP_002674824.1 predicted protein [Naegleria gruberi strain NEG-M]
MPAHLSLLEKAKQSTKLSLESLSSGVEACGELYDEVLNGVVRNVKMGPFKATSGIELPYYLNASTNFMDKRVAPKIVEIMGHYLVHIQQTLPSLQAENLPPSQQNLSEQPLVLVGMELAGGMLVSQFAAYASTLHEKQGSKTVYEAYDFLYIRKNRKSTGTCQQLEGEQKFTERKPDSPLLHAVWVDDALSTGSSLLDGIKMLKEDYNIEVKAALYLVDRSKDRLSLPDEKQKLADPTFENIELYSIFDLHDVDAKIEENKKKKNL